MIQQKCEQPSLWYLIKQFIHFRRFAFTIFLPLMGAATAMQHGTLAQILFIVATVFQFHIFTYVLNDVIDLPVDRLMAKRADHPVVHPLNETQGKNKINCVHEGVQDGTDKKEL
jgi:4-hydroxybenzoate polyprenyltransferase